MNAVFLASYVKDRSEELMYNMPMDSLLPCDQAI